MQAVFDLRFWRVLVADCGTYSTVCRWWWLGAGWWCWEGLGCRGPRPGPRPARPGLLAPAHPPPPPPPPTRRRPTPPVRPLRSRSGLGSGTLFAMRTWRCDQTAVISCKFVVMESSMRRWNQVSTVTFGTPSSRWVPSVSVSCVRRRIPRTRSNLKRTE